MSTSVRPERFYTKSRLRFLYVAGLLLIAAAVHLPRAGGQRDKDVLTDKQTEDLREHADQPVEKLKLYVGYIEQRMNEIHRFASDRSAPERITQIHSLYEEVSSLCDELDDNMDAYDHEQADLRKALTAIAEKSGQWSSVLNEPESQSGYDFARKDALEALYDLHEDAVDMLVAEGKYFATHKKGEGG
jgi:hypothetical protein